MFLFYKVLPILICLVADLCKQITCDISCISSIMLFPFVLQDDVHMKANVMHLFPYYACFFPGWIWPCSCTITIVSFSCKCLNDSQISHFSSLGSGSTFMCFWMGHEFCLLKLLWISLHCFILVIVLTPSVSHAHLWMFSHLSLKILRFHTS